MELDREEACAAVPVPESIAARLVGYKWARNTVGQSGGAVYRLHGKADAPDMFLKYGKDAFADDISDEVERLRWLGKHVPAPAVVHVARAPGETWLFMTAVLGKTAYQVLEACPELRLAVVDELALFLRRIHGIAVSECPFANDHGYRLSCARARIDAGLVEEDDFDEEREGWTAEQVWEALHCLLPLAPDPVVTHGDFSLDNLLICDGKVAGCIDAGRVGIADRYQDLAITWRCLGEFGTALQKRFLDQYGISGPDHSKLTFYSMLDELF